MRIDKIILDGITYDIGSNIENTELTNSTTDVPSTNLMKTIVDEINNKIQENTNNIDELTSGQSLIDANKSNVYRTVDIATGVSIPLRTYALSIIAIGHPQYSEKIFVAVALTLGRSDWNKSKLLIISGALTDVGCDYNFDTSEHIYIKSSKQIMWGLVLS